jgi:hypothetical protein
MAEENTNVNQGAQNDAGTTSTTETNTNSSTVENTSGSAQNDSQGDKATPDLEALIQRAVDRATNKLGNENKKLKNQLETIKKEKLSDDEVKKLELADKEADIADREAKLKKKENELFAIKAIKDAGLDDGSSNALELVEFVMTDDEETTIARVKTFENLVKKFVAAEVNRTFKANGRNPEKGGSTESTQNTVVTSIGKMAADRNAETSKVLNHYLGGK